LDLAVGGSSYNTEKYRGNLSEAILFGVDKYTSGDIGSIRENIGDYFTQNTPLLDTYTGAAACYALRLMRTAYTGDAVEVYNGSSYASIGFNVFGELNTVALADHCGSNDGFVSKWYDQSGNTNTAAQTTTANMPKIYDGTTGVVTENGKPAVEFDRSNDNHLDYSNFISNATNAITVAKNTASSWGAITGQFGGALRCLNNADWNASANADDFHYLGGLFIDGTQLSSGTIDAAFQRLIYANAQTGGFTDSLQFIGKGYPNRNWNGSIQELIIYTSDQSSNRTNIEDSINTFYSIY